MIVVILHPNGVVDNLRLDLAADYLAELRAVVGGNLETVPLPHACYLVFREMGKSIPHEPNMLASGLARRAQSITGDDYIAGTAVIVPQELLSPI